MIVAIMTPIITIIISGITITTKTQTPKKELKSTTLAVLQKLTSSGHFDGPCINRSVSRHPNVNDDGNVGLVTATELFDSSWQLGFFESPFRQAEVLSSLTHARADVHLSRGKGRVMRKKIKVNCLGRLQRLCLRPDFHFFYDSVIYIICMFRFCVWYD